MNENTKPKKKSINTYAKLLTIFLVWGMLFSVAVAVNNETVQVMTDNTISQAVSISQTVSEIIYPKNGGGGGSGGMGVITNEPFENILCSERNEHDWRVNSTLLYSFRQCGEFDVSIISSENIYDVMLKLEILKDKSARTTVAPAGSVYQYFNLYSGSKRFSEATIRFKVPITWTAETVTLMQWTGTEWKSLIMKSLGNDASYRYYEAYTNTFSNFAIVGYVPAPAPPAPAPAPPAPVVATPLPTTEITDLTNASQPFKIPFPISGLELVMVLCLVGLWYRKK